MARRLSAWRARGQRVMMARWMGCPEPRGHMLVCAGMHRLARAGALGSGQGWQEKCALPAIIVAWIFRVPLRMLNA